MAFMVLSVPLIRPRIVLQRGLCHRCALEAHSVIEKGRRLVNESMGDKTGMVVGAMKCIGG